MDLDKRKLHDDLITLVGATLHSFEQRLDGKYPTQYDIEEWKKRYTGTVDLPPFTVELNPFRTLVDDTVGNIFTLIDMAEK